MMKRNSYRNLINSLRKEEDDEYKRKLFRRAYHSHFEGYSEYYVEDENGRLKPKRVYTGKYYIFPGSDIQWGLRKALNLLLSTFIIFTFVWSASANCVPNMTVPGTVMTVVGIVAVAVAVIGSLAYLVSPRKMTIGEWRSSSERIGNGFACTAAACFALCCYHLYFLAAVPSADGCGRPVTGYGLCVLASAIGCMIEKNTEYNTEQSEAVVPKYAVYIR